MRGPNERYNTVVFSGTMPLSKKHAMFTRIVEPDETKDILGQPLKVGSYVIWQPYSAHDGMHIGKIISINEFAKKHYEYIIATDGRSNNKHIKRFSWELISYLPRLIHSIDQIEAEE